MSRETRAIRAVLAHHDETVERMYELERTVDRQSEHLEAAGDDTRRLEGALGKAEAENAELRQRVIDCKRRLGLPPDSGPLPDAGALPDAVEPAALPAAMILPEVRVALEASPGQTTADRARRVVADRDQLERDLSACRSNRDDLAQRLEASRKVAEERQDVIRDVRRELAKVNEDRDRLRKERDALQARADGLRPESGLYLRGPKEWIKVEEEDYPDWREWPVVQDGLPPIHQDFQPHHKGVVLLWPEDENRP